MGLIDSFHATQKACKGRVCVGAVLGPFFRRGSERIPTPHPTVGGRLHSATVPFPSPGGWHVVLGCRCPRSPCACVPASVHPQLTHTLMYIDALMSLPYTAGTQLYRTKIHPSSFEDDTEYREQHVRHLADAEMESLNLLRWQHSTLSYLLPTSAAATPEVINITKGLFGLVHYSQSVGVMDQFIANLVAEDEVERVIFGACQASVCHAVRREDIWAALLKGLGTVSVITSACILLARAVYVRLRPVECAFEPVAMEEVSASGRMRSQKSLDNPHTPFGTPIPCGT